MSTKDNEQSLRIETTLRGSKEIFIASYTMELDIPISKIAEKLELGDPICWSHIFSMMSYDCLRSASEVPTDSSLEQSTGTPSKNSILILSLDQLLTIFSLLETLEKRLVSLRPKLTQTGVFEPAITLQVLQLVGSRLALTTLELEEISRILKSDSDASSSPTQE